MKELRKRMDEIDSEIMGLIAERMHTAEQIGEIKRSAGIGIIDTDREAEVVAGYRDLATAAGIDPDFAESVCRLLISESRKLQK